MTEENSPFPPSRPALRKAIIEMLAEHGPMTTEQLTERLHAERPELFAANDAPTAKAPSKSLIPISE